MFDHCKAITPSFLGQGSAKIYTFVRRDLGVPFHRGILEDPTFTLREGERASFPPEKRKTIGSLIGIVYESIRSGELYTALAAAVKNNML